MARWVALGALGLLAGCGEGANVDKSQGAATSVQLSVAGVPGGAWGFNPACMFPGTFDDPHLFTAASVGGTITIAGATAPVNNGTFKILEYIFPMANTANHGNIVLPHTCVSETFPASATVFYQAP